MSRIRTIKPEFPHSESIGRLSRDARLLFIQLWTFVDDEGRSRASSRMLASLLFPYDDDAPALLAGWLGELENQGHIFIYEIDGASYLEIQNWHKHQKIDHPGKSKIPAPSDEARSSIRELSRGLATDLVPSTLVPSTFNQENINIPDIQVESKISPIGEESDFVSEDGTVVVTAAELQQWIEDYPLVKNIPGRLRNSCRTWLKDIPADERQHVFVMHLEKQQRQREEKVPKTGPRKIPLRETEAYKQDVERERAQKEREKALGRLQ